MAETANGVDEKSQQEHKGIGKTAVVLVVLGLLALVFTLSSLSLYIAGPWPMDVTVEDTAAEARVEQGGVVVDKAYNRLLFLDSESNVVNVLASVFASPVSFYQCAAANSSGIYVSELTYFGDTDYVETERVVKYGFDGQRKGVMLEISHDLGDKREAGMAIKGVYATEDECLVTLVDYPEAGISVWSLPLEPGSKDKNYSIDCGTLPDGSLAFGAAVDTSSQTVMAVSVLGDVFVRPVKEGSWQSSKEADVAIDENVVVAARGYSLAGSSMEGRTLTLAPLVMARSVIFWLCVAYLVLALVALAVRGIVRSVRSRNFHSLEVVGGAVLAVGIAGGIAIYYSANMMQAKNESAAANLYGCSNTVAVCLQDELAAASLQYQSEGSLSVETYNEIAEKLELCSFSEALAGKGVSYYYLAKDDDGYPVCIVDFAQNYISGAPLMAKQRVTFDKMADSLGSGKTVVEDDQYISRALVKDSEGTTVGMLAASKKATPHNAFVTKELIALFVALLDVLVGISFIILEGKYWKACFSLRSRLRREGAEHPEIAIGRPLLCLTKCALAVDGALLPLIAKDMLAGTDFAGNGLMIALPAFALSVGLLVGVPLQAFLNRHIPIRRYLLICSVLATALFVASAAAVSAGSVLLLSVMVFLSHMFIQVVMSFVRGLPLYAKDSGTRSAMNQSFGAATVSAAALGTLVCGNVADAFGNQFVFLVGGVFAALVLLFVFVFVRGAAVEHLERLELEKKEEKGGLAQIFDVLKDPYILVLLLCVVMCLSMSSGYKSYIFPLVAADGGVSKAIIASITVYCNAFVFYVAPAMTKIEIRIGSRRMIIASCGFLAAVLLVFFFNTSLSWAIAALVASLVAGKAIEPCYSSFWQNRIVETGADRDVAYPSIMIAYKGVRLLRNPILGALFNVVGLSMLSPVVGIYCAFNTAAFALVTRRGGRKKSHSDN